MMTKLILLAFFVAIVAKAELPNEADIVLCQDQAENFGNGKGDDSVSPNCIESFKKMAPIAAIKESSELKIKIYGYRNMIIVEEISGSSILTNIIAGSYTELKAIHALTVDEKNREIVVLEESGDVLFLSSKITGNIAPFRIIKHKELTGASELVIDNVKDQVVLINNKTKRILFFSRLANINGRVGKQKLDIIKTIDTPTMELKDISMDFQKSELRAFDISKNKNVIFDLK